MLVPVPFETATDPADVLRRGSAYATAPCRRSRCPLTPDAVVVDREQWRPVSSTSNDDRRTSVARECLITFVSASL